MFHFLFGWRKASKCKKLIKKVHCRLKLLKNKRQAIVRQLREDLAELIKNGYEEGAFNRVEQLIKDESIMSVYELLDHFCDFILIHLSYIRRHKDCPNDINEAVSSLIYASARCGDLPELLDIRKLFGEYYGNNFAMTALELFPGNLVNQQIKEKLSTNSIPDDQKYRMVDEIARDYCLQPEILALEYRPEWHQLKMTGDYEHQAVETDSLTNDIIVGYEMQPSSVEIEREVACVDTFSKNLLASTCDPSSHMPMEKVESFTKPNSPFKYKVSVLETKEKRMTTATSAENFAPSQEEMVLDYGDIEECQCSSVSKDGDFQDQRLFKFRSSSTMAGKEKDEFCNDRSNRHQDESLSEMSRALRKSGIEPRKRPRRRSLSLEYQTAKDAGCILYYNKPFRSLSYHRNASHCCRNHLKTSVKANEQTNSVQKRLKQHGFPQTERCFESHWCKCDEKRRLSLNLSMNNYSFENPLCCCSFKDKQKRGMRTLAGFPRLDEQIFSGECLPRHSEWKPRIRCCENCDVMYNIFTYSSHQSECDMLNRESRADTSGFPSSNACCPRNHSSLTRNQTLPPYSRAATMPPERPKDNQKDSFFRTNSCPTSQNPKHVHPKLPDYDDIAAKFIALKKANLQIKDSLGG